MYYTHTSHGRESTADTANKYRWKETLLSKTNQKSIIIITTGKMDPSPLTIY